MPEAHSQRRADARDDVHEEQQLSEGEGKQFLREVVYHRADENAHYAFRNRNLRDGWEDTPFLDYAPKIENGMQTEIEINAGYKKMAMFGADAAIPIGETVLRLEGAFFPKRHFQTAAQKILFGGENTEEHNNLAALAGLDWMREGWTFTAQYFCDCLFGETENLERTRKFEHGTTLSISKSLLSETLKLSASGVLMLKDFDSAIELSGEYSLSDSIFLELGGYIFNEGKETGTYGKYKDYSSIYLKARYVF